MHRINLLPGNEFDVWGWLEVANCEAFNGLRVSSGLRLTTVSGRS